MGETTSECDRCLSQLFPCGGLHSPSPAATGDHHRVPMTHASVARRANGSPVLGRHAEFAGVISDLHAIAACFSPTQLVLVCILSCPQFYAGSVASLHRLLPRLGPAPWSLMLNAIPSLVSPSAIHSKDTILIFQGAHIRETVLDISRPPALSPSKHRRHRSTRWFPVDALPRPTSQLDKRHTRAHTLHNMVAIVRQAIALDETDYAEEARANLSRRSEWGTIKSLSIDNFDDDEDSVEAEGPRTLDRDSNTLNAARLVIQVPNHNSNVIHESFDMPDTPTSVDTLPLYVFRQSTPPYSSDSPSTSYPAEKSLFCLSLESFGKITGGMEIEILSRRDSEVQDWSDVFSLDQYIGV